MSLDAWRLLSLLTRAPERLPTARSAQAIRRSIRNPGLLAPVTARLQVIHQKYLLKLIDEGAVAAPKIIGDHRRIVGLRLRTGGTPRYCLLPILDAEQRRRAPANRSQGTRRGG